MADCPTPWKVKHNHADAVRHAIRIKRTLTRNDKRPVKAYPCGDRWHVGHEPRKAGR